MEKKEASKKLLWIFAIGQFGWSLLSGIVSNWLVYYYQPSDENIALGQIIFIPQNAIFIGLTVMGVIAAVGRIFDAVTDPLIASKSDRCHHKEGRRIPFMKRAAIPFGLITVCMFLSPIQGESTLNAVFLFICAMLFYLCMTLYCTPFNALIPELGRTQESRINLSTYISITFFLGTAVSYILPNIAGLIEPSVGYIASIRITIAIMATVAVICMLIPAFLINEHEYADTTPSDTPAFKSLLKTFSNKEFQHFVVSDILYWIAITMFQTGLPFYITVLMKLDAGMSFVLFALMTVLSLIFYAPVNIFAKKIGKKKLISFGFLFFCGTYVLTTFCGLWGISGMIWGLIVAFLASIPMAILGILPQAVVADIAEADYIQTKENRAGMFYAARTFAFKLGQSVAMLAFTSVAKIGTDGFGYRVSAVVAAVLCFAGAMVFLTYKEKNVLKVLEAARKEG